MNITGELYALRDERYADFQRRLLPTLPSESIVGVRTPALKALAKRLSHEPEADTFLATLPHCLFEENQLHAFLISAERDIDHCIALVDAFLPYVDNWATCDQLSPRVFSKNHAALLPHIRRWMAAQHEYTVRFGIGMLLRHFLDDAFQPEYLDSVVAIHHDEYYITMMQAWYLATALAKQWDASIPLIAGLPEPLRRKTIQKACESFRVSDDHKHQLREINRQP